jgi:NADH-quinone oxidoreductase subunit L
MGGLAPRMMMTTWTFIFGAAALSGIFPFAGFFSKDEILASVFHEGHITLWALLLAGAFMTAFYTFRLVFLAFTGSPRMSKEAAHHTHESPLVMTVPLVILALLALLAGVLVGIPFPHGTLFARFLAPVFPLQEVEHSSAVVFSLAILSTLVALGGVVLAWTMYGRRPVRAETIGAPTNPIHALLLNKYYVDELYDALFVRPIYRLSQWCARAFDLGVIDGIVNGVGRVVVAWGQVLRRVQTGFVMTYALGMLLGAVAVVAFLLSRLGSP